MDVRKLPLLALLAAVALSAAEKRPVDYVDPRIDTHQTRWIFFASASRPFGMVALSPDTKLEGDWGAGYIYVEPYIRAFSHIHDWQLAGVPVMPIVGRMNGHEGYEAYKAPFSHEKEVVRAGYHKVVLDNSGITAELTSTKRVGFHRYHFPATEDAYILLDTGAPVAMTKMADAALRRTGPQQLAGFSKMAPTQRREKPCTVYFVAEFDQPFTEFGGWEKSAAGKAVKQAADHVSGADSGGYVRFRFAQPAQVRMKVAISYVSEENARLNLQTELPGWDFDATVRASAGEWNEWLGKLQVSGGTEQQRVKFYTDLWHALLGRRTFSDVDGRYVDNTGAEPRVRQVPLDAQGTPTRATYNSDAFWGSHWNLNVLWSFAYPRMMSEQISSLVDYYTNGGITARGPAGGNYSFVMIGDQSAPLIAAAYNKGIRDFDVQSAYAGMKKNAFPGGIRDRAGYEFGPNPSGGGMPAYVERGWIPATPGRRGMHRAGAAQTLEYAYQDWCLAQFAKALGKQDDYALFSKRAENWKNLFDPSVGWIRPKNPDGTWLDPFTPTCQGAACPGFVESNSAIYTYFVPHDMPGLVQAIGGPQKFIDKLNHQFELAAPKRYVTPHGRHAEEWVDYENQPSCHMAHLFTYAGAPWLTQYWVHRVKEESYGAITPFAGYNGDEDQGQMGGIGVLMAMGLFDVTGGAGTEPRYELTSPLFDRITVTLDPRYAKGRQFTITTRNNESGNIYIQSAKLNGKPLSGRFWITHQELTAGGTLEISLGPQPNKQWGVAAR
ncbi:MAG: glycoside hydrolase family 92 protein [Acidobacteria bacterium]|nr:glycoside hydrolase family 92 protein [Acidobacteriota bacterium]